MLMSLAPVKKKACQNEEGRSIRSGLRETQGLVAASSKSAASAASTSFCAGLRLVHGERTPTMIGTVELFNRRLSVLVGSHFHETEALASSRVPILNNLCTGDLTNFPEQLFEVASCHTVTEITDIQLSSHHSSPNWSRGPRDFRGRHRKRPNCRPDRREGRKRPGNKATRRSRTSSNGKPTSPYYIQPVKTCH